MRRAVRTLSRWLAAAVLFPAWWAGCGGGHEDGEDEEGAKRGDTRVELVYVVGTDSAAMPVGDSGAKTAPAEEHAAVSPGPEDEAGGDDLIPYDPGGDYTVQVGTFSDATRARERVRELDALGYPAYAVAHPGGRQVRVRIGYFTTRDQAERFGQRFTRDHGGQYWVDRRLGEEGAGR